MEIKEQLEKIKDQLSPFRSFLEKMGRDIERSFRAINDGYFEAALTNVGIITEDILKDVWRKEKISGIPLKKTIEQLTVAIKRKIEIDRLVDDYINDIQKARNRAAHGEKVLIDDCIETLRKLPTILDWYKKAYLNDEYIVETFLCPECNHRVREDWKNCPFCGVILKKERMNCFFCGEEVEEEWKNCPHCGNTLKTKIETVKGVRSESATFFVGKKLGKFEVRSIIGRGAMGVVFKVWDNIEEDFKAIKMVPHAIAFDHLAFNSLKKEVKAASKVIHPNVVKVMGLEATDMTYFIVMEYIEGETLGQKLAESPDEKLNEQDVIRYMSQIAEGLNEAHKRGVVHLDLKPQNIMVKKSGEIKILDFSISYQMTQSVTVLTGQHFSTGTLPYMAPEQLSKKFGKIDKQTDIWGFGATMYHLLSGKIPYENREQIVNDDESAFDIQHISEPTENFIKKCMEKNRKYRYKNMGEVIEALHLINKDIHKSLHSTQANSSDIKLELPSKKPKKNEQYLMEETLKHQREDEIQPVNSHNAQRVGKSVDISKNINLAISQLYELDERIKSRKKGNDTKENISIQSEQPTITTEEIEFKAPLKFVSLRSTSQIVSHNQAKLMVIRKGFFEKSWNPKGSFVNQFELIKMSGDSVVIDHSTGLMWMQAGASERLSFNEGQEYIQFINEKKYGSYNDWHLPTIEEGASLLMDKTGNQKLYINPIFSEIQGWIYTGDKEQGKVVWIINFITGSITRDFLNSGFIRPVRGHKKF